MRTFLRIVLKPLSFLPAICMMYLIFSFSSQDGVTSSQLSYKVSYKIVEIGDQVLDTNFEPWEIESLATRFHGAIRKIAHMTEYFALAVSVAFPLYVYGLRGILLMLVAGLFCVAFACGDEYHQSLVAGRSPSKRDVLIDSFGIFWGIVLVRIVGWTGRKTIFRPLARKRKKKDFYEEPQNYTEPRNFGEPQNFQNMNPAPSVYPPGSAPYMGYGPANPTTYGAPYPNGSVPPSGPYYGNGSAPYPPNYGYVNPCEEDDFYENPDSLSEDMSFRKLMHDIKDQQRTVHRERKSSKKPKIKGTELLDDEGDSNPD